MASNLLIRSISAILLIPVVIYMIYSEPHIFYASGLLIASLMALEWHGLIKNLRRKWVWRLVAFIYIASFIFSLCWIRNQSGGQSLLIWLFVTTWMSDTGAFAFGKIIGGPKLLKKISPSKTWAGLLGCIIFSGVSGLIFNKPVYTSILLGFISQMGDFLESWIKRQAGVKDSGSIIPGHGGILDRVDGLVASSLALFIILMFFRNFLISIK